MRSTPIPANEPPLPVITGITLVAGFFIIFMNTIRAIRNVDRGILKVAQTLDFPKGSIVALDRGYIDYHLFTRWTRAGVYFVSRLKKNADIQIVQDYPVPKGSKVLKDQKVRLQAFVAGRPDLEDLRMVTVWLEDKQLVIQTPSEPPQRFTRK